MMSVTFCSSNRSYSLHEQKLFQFYPPRTESFLIHRWMFHLSSSCDSSWNDEIAIISYDGVVTGKESTQEEPPIHKEKKLDRTRMLRNREEATE